MSHSPNNVPLPDDNIPSSFPSTHEEFQSDPRVSWSRLANKWTLESDDGAEYEFDEALKRWIPVIDESLAEQQQAIYAVSGVDEREPAGPVKKKRKKIYTSNDPEDEQDTKKHRGNDKEGRPSVPRKNTAVYITNLPLDTDEEEIRGVFSKYGVISEEIDTGKPRIKLYRNEDGVLKGDCLVVYFRPESVSLAIQMLDDSPLRVGSSSQGNIKVQAADFSYKAQQEAPTQTSKREKRKIIAKTQKLNNKLADWDDDDPSAVAETGSKWDKLVILKHMFTLKELEDDPTIILDLKEDVREECEKLGDITNVVLYDKEEDGVVTVRFRDSESARACVSLMDGRFFAGQQVKAYISNGTEKFKKSSNKNVEDAEEEETDRLEKFGSWLEGEKADTEA